MKHILKEEDKNNEILDLFKNFFIWIIILIFLELAFRLSMGFNFEIESTINIVLYSIMISSILSIFSRIFSDKINNIITAIFLLILRSNIFNTVCIHKNIQNIFFCIKSST